MASDQSQVGETMFPPYLTCWSCIVLSELRLQTRASTTSRGKRNRQNSKCGQQIRCHSAQEWLKKTIEEYMKTNGKQVPTRWTRLLSTWPKKDGPSWSYWSHVEKSRWPNPGPPLCFAINSANRVLGVLFAFHHEHGGIWHELQCACDTFALSGMHFNVILLWGPADYNIGDLMPAHSLTRTARSQTLDSTPAGSWPQGLASWPLENNQAGPIQVPAANSISVLAFRAGMKYGNLPHAPLPPRLPFTLVSLKPSQPSPLPTYT